MTYRLFIRKNEFSHTMVACGKFKSILQACRYVRNSYSMGLGRLTLSRGIYWSEEYKQLMIGKELAAYDSLAMLVIERKFYD